MATALELGATIPILILSTIGNILTLCVLQRPAFSEKSMTILLRGLAVADLCTTWLDPLSMNLIIPGFKENTAQMPCKVYGWVFALVSIASSWTLVMVTVERAIVVYYPLKMDLKFNKRRAALLVVAIWLFWGAVGSFTFVSTKTWVGVCSLSQNLDTIKLFVFMALYSLIPAILMITCNILIIVALRRASASRRRMSTRQSISREEKNGVSSSRASTSSSRQQERLTIMLITISFVFVLLTLPEILVYAVEFFSGSLLPDAIVWVCNFLRRLNHAINFILYCVSGVMFRRELELLLKGWFSRMSCSKNRHMSISDECDGAIAPLRAKAKYNRERLTTEGTDSTDVFSTTEDKV